MNGNLDSFNLEEEMRWDFLVDSKRKRLWKVEMNLLCQLDEFCKENNITYYADYGTLLGAVRHKGFIPWDDDIDVTMTRPDYMRFIELAPSWFNSPYFVQNYYTDHFDNRVTMFTRIIDDRTTMIPKDCNAGPEHHQGVFIDVFPLDPAPAEFPVREVPDIIKIAMELWMAAASPKTIIEDMIAGKMPVAGMDTIIDILGLPYEDRLRLFEGILLDTYPKFDTIHTFSNIYRSAPMSKEWFASTVLLPFETIMIPAPVEYEKVLTAHYGDYSVPVVTVGHDIEFTDPDRPYTDYIR